MTTAVLPAPDAAALGAGAEEVDQAELDAQAKAERMEELNPCRICGSMQNAGPEREAHVFEHCWKCGFRPFQTVPAGTAMAGAMAAPNAAAMERAMGELRKGIVADVLAAIAAGAKPEEISVSGAAVGTPAAGEPVTL